MRTVVERVREARSVLFPSRVPQPWMFEVELTINGAPVRGQVMRFSMLGRLRMASRVLVGRPAVRGVAS